MTSIVQVLEQHSRASHLTDEAKHTMVRLVGRLFHSHNAYIVVNTTWDEYQMLHVLAVGAGEDVMAVVWKSLSNTTCLNHPDCATHDHRMTSHIRGFNRQPFP